MPEIPARRICVVRLSALGDVIHALAMVNGVRRGYPDAEITWIVHPVPYQAVREQPAIDRFVILERGGAASFLALAKTLKGERFDLALVPQVSFKAGLVAALLDARVKLGFDFRRSRELHWFFCNAHLPSRPAGHVQEHYLEFLDALGILREPVEWNLRFTDGELEWRDAFFARLGRPAVAFVAASAHPEKDWTVEGHARAMEHVDRVVGMQPLLVGGPSERERRVADAIVAACRTRVEVALERPVRHTLLQLSGSAVVVAPDTGPLHAAVAMGVPTVGLYGMSNPRRVGPFRAYADLLVDHFTEAGETHARRVTRPGRMATITPEEVIAKIDTAVARYVRFGPQGGTQR
ncbi:MAG: glycosyltransferase family 9 protein [Acidobacteriota bacterium]